MEGQFSRTEHGGLELCDGLGAARCSGALKGEVGAGGRQQEVRPERREEPHHVEPCGQVKRVPRAMGSHGRA